MGIDVDAAGVVTFNPAHEQRVVTDPNRPIPTTLCGSLPVVSVFRRRSTRAHDDDGNPLIYALKGLNGYSIARKDVRHIWTAARTILPNALNGVQYDIVVPLPSSAGVARILATRASRHGGRCLVVPCLEKATVAQVLAAAPPTKFVEKRLRPLYTSQLATLQRLSPRSIIQMKRINLRVRPYFTPIVPNGAIALCANRRVLLVDDIFGSGSSLVAAEAALKAAGVQTVEALTLLSKLA